VISADIFTQHVSSGFAGLPSVWVTHCSTPSYHSIYKTPAKTPHPLRPTSFTATTPSPPSSVYQARSSPVTLWISNTLAAKAPSPFQPCSRESSCSSSPSRQTLITRQPCPVSKLSFRTLCMASCTRSESSFPLSRINRKQTRVLTRPVQYSRSLPRSE